MNSRHCIATIVGITFGLIVLATPAEAGDTLRFKGLSAEAFFSSTDPTDPCISTDVFVFASDNAIISHDPPGPPNSSSGAGASIFILQFDSCNFIEVLAADCSAAPLPDTDFQVIGRKLDSATLNTTLGCFDFLGGPSFDVSVALTWTAVGDPVRQSSNFHFRTPGFILNSRSSGTFRSAEASGSVFDGITNFTPDPASSATIGNVKSGEVVID